MKELTIQDVKLLSPLNLAYIGDGIYELIAREHIIAQGNLPVSRLHRKTVSIVCASAQSAGYEAIADRLCEEEAAVYRRGRNAGGNHVPRNADVQEYRRATGVEALFGYLYLTDRVERARELFEIMYLLITAAENQTSIE